MSVVQQADCLVQIEHGCPPAETGYLDQLPTWLADATFSARLEAMLKRGEKLGQLTPSLREAAIRETIERYFADIFDGDTPAVCNIDGVLTCLEKRRRSV
jgi:hypothetical protein